MKVLFSNPPWWPQGDDGGPVIRADGRRLAGVRAGSRWPHTLYARSQPDQFVFGDYLPYPFFLGYAASYAAKHSGAQIVLRDSIALRESYRSFEGHLKQARYDLVFIESASPSWEHDGGLIRRIKQMLPDTRLVVTGPITANAAKILEDYPVVACIKGEYEKGAVKVIAGAEGILEHDLLTLDEMNAAPFPYYDEVIARRYWDPNPRGQTAPQAQVWSSRGCPFKCIFCVWPATMTGNDPLGDQKRTVRHYTPAYMEAFLRDLTGCYGFKSVYFDDDTFNIGNRHVLDMSGVMGRIGLPWSAMCRADTSRMESWAAMQAAGCFGVKLGVESGNQWVVDNIVNKHLDLDIVRASVTELKRLGMSVHGTFTYGLPGETHAQMRDTKSFIASLSFDTYQESGTATIEGTPLAHIGDATVQGIFPGVNADDSGFRIETDGGKKWRELAASLRNS
ncbi:MAG: radical SAM protein [Alphaproteobacteria bacterium]|nr:radical SAM protein [Alphaproteobacteria bacterium]